MQNTTPKPLVQLKNVTKTYHNTVRSFTALKNVTASIAQGEFVTVVGASGSGKTTFLNLLAGIDRPTQGQLIVGGTSMSALSESQLAQWRGRYVGLVFQFFQLLPTLTIIENVQLAMDFGNVIPPPQRRQRAQTLLHEVAIADQAHKLPSTLSGGQQQRAAIARALANDPALLLCDEPTGNLDSANRQAILELFRALNQRGHTIVMITHEHDASAFANRQLTLSDGQLIASQKTRA